ncbi:uncharacterized protein LOC144146320 [Haemaphysalis longicornis]
MKLALWLKLLVIVIHYFPNLGWWYQFFNHLLRSFLESKSWKDYAKHGTSLDFVAVSIVVLFAIHDFYEGVKQQGRFSVNGLLDVYEPVETEEQGAPQSFNPAGTDLAFPGAVAAAGPYAPAGTYAPAGPFPMPYPNQPAQIQGPMFPGFYAMNRPGGHQQVAPPAAFQYMAPPAGSQQMAPSARFQQVAPPDGIRQRQQYNVPKPPRR